MTHATAIALLEAAKISYAKMYGLAHEPKDLVALMLTASKIDKREIIKDGGIHSLSEFIHEHHEYIVAVACRYDAYAVLRKNGRQYLRLVTNRTELQAGIAAWWNECPDHYPMTHNFPILLSPQIPEDEVWMLNVKGKAFRFFWLDFEKV